MAATVFALMGATGLSEETILSWPVERYNTYVEILDEREAALHSFMKALLGR
jgi:hypothetical protein